MRKVSNVRQWALLVGAAVLLVPAIAIGSDLVIPNTFSAGTLIQSAQVNANFAAIRDEVNKRIEGKYGRMAYFWVDACGTATCTIPATWAFNSHGALPTMTRSAAGAYTVSVPNFGTTNGANIQLTPWGANNNICKITNWGITSGTLNVNLRCFTLAGANADTSFSFQAVH